MGYLQRTGDKSGGGLVHCQVRQADPRRYYSRSDGSWSNQTKSRRALLRVAFLKEGSIDSYRGSRRIRGRQRHSLQAIVGKVEKLIADNPWVVRYLLYNKTDLTNCTAWCILMEIINN